jgi:hypothetical protein
MIEGGRPCSQLRGVFQGREEAFSGSVLAHPEVRLAAKASKNSKASADGVQHVFMKINTGPGHLP